MTEAEILKLVLQAQTVAPHLTGGDRQTERRRTSVLINFFAGTTYQDAYQALVDLGRDGTSKDAMNWSTISHQARVIARRRIDQEQSKSSAEEKNDGLIPMPADFWQVVTFHRDRVRREAAARACPVCEAAPAEPCKPRPGRKGFDARAGIGPHGMHDLRLDHGPALTHPSDHTPRSR